MISVIERILIVTTVNNVDPLNVYICSGSVETFHAHIYIPFDLELERFIYISLLRLMTGPTVR